ncbi:MAG: FAD-linked oxidase C-terminal domain-containing protein [Thiotrichaceae bacterium]|nr:FAD-linked oxidase C-terminal domain-containing protein [Thiotrichaceae bacterium]
MDKFPQLLTILPAHKVLLTDEAVRPYECDGLPAYKQRPGAVVLPDTVDEIKAVLRFCHQQQIPIVPRGAGTGLSGGALPRKDGVLLSLAKFKQILKINPHARTATLQPGVRNLAISQAAAAYNLYYAPDPSSQIACTIGGNVAENSGGVHCLKYGLTTHNILQLKVLTIDGELLTIGSEALDSSGYDLLALLTGSEGLLGIIIEITVKLLIKPPQVKVLLASFDQVNLAGKAVADIIGSGIIPAGLEMMDNAALCAAEDFVKAGYPKGAAAILLCELDGNEKEVDLQVERVQNLLKQAGATEIRVAQTEHERMQFWSGRKNAFPAVGRISPDYYCMDGTIPRKHLPEVLEGINQLSQHYNLPVVNVFHAGDGNLHPLILYDANNAGELEKAEQFGGKILELSVAYGGAITGEHGVGIEKIDQMCVQFNADELAQFHSIKQAFDPLKLLNPGKAIPTLHRCAEFGALHVHDGELPFPELERF